MKMPKYGTEVGTLDQSESKSTKSEDEPLKMRSQSAKRTMKSAIRSCADPPVSVSVSVSVSLLLSFLQVVLTPFIHTLTQSFSHSISLSLTLCISNCLFILYCPSKPVHNTSTHVILLQITCMHAQFLQCISTK